MFRRQFFTLRNDAASTGGNPYKVLLINVSRMNVRRHFFTERIAIIWNSLPPSIVDFYRAAWNADAVL